MHHRSGVSSGLIHSRPHQTHPHNQHSHRIAKTCLCICHQMNLITCMVCRRGFIKEGNLLFSPALTCEFMFFTWYIRGGNNGGPEDGHGHCHQCNSPCHRKPRTALIFAKMLSRQFRFPYCLTFTSTDEVAVEAFLCVSL